MERVGRCAEKLRYVTKNGANPPRALWRVASGPSHSAGFVPRSCGHCAFEVDYGRLAYYYTAYTPAVPHPRDRGAFCCESCVSLYEMCFEGGATEITLLNQSESFAI